MRYSSLRVGIILFCSIALGSAGFAAPVRSLPDTGSSDTDRQDVPVHGIDPSQPRSQRFALSGLFQVRDRWMGSQSSYTRGLWIMGQLQYPPE